MAQVTDRNIGANPTGFDMRTEINNIIAALESDNSGSSEPLNTVAYMKWLDTSNATYYYYKERNHDNTAWVTLFRYTVATKIMEVVNNGTDLTTTLALKAPLASPTFTGTVVLPSTTSIGTITNTELSYLEGVTSSIQTQFTGKQATLVSGTNIKTINSTSLLGGGDLVVSAPNATNLVKGIDYKGLLAEYEVIGSAVTSINFSGLDINTHKSYRVEIELTNATAGAITLYCFVNGDTTLTNYWSQIAGGSGALYSGTRLNNPTCIDLVASSKGFASLAISKPNGYPSLTGTYVKSDSSSTLVYSVGVNKTATVTNITQLTFTSSVASTIGVGSKIRLYRGDV